MTIQGSIRKDMVAACYKYRLTADHAPKLADMTPEQMQTLVANLGHECLFRPRDDFLQLLSSLPGLLGALSTVRANRRPKARRVPLERRLAKNP